MRSKMGLIWCEIVILSEFAKRLLGKLAPLCLGITCTGAIGALGGTPTSWLEAAEVPPDTIINIGQIQGLEDSSCVGLRGCQGLGESGLPVDFHSKQDVFFSTPGLPFTPAAVPSVPLFSQQLDPPSKIPLNGEMRCLPGYSPVSPQAKGQSMLNLTTPLANRSSALLSHEANASPTLACVSEAAALALGKPEAIASPALPNLKIPPLLSPSLVPVGTAVLLGKQFLASQNLVAPSPKLLPAENLPVNPPPNPLIAPENLQPNPNQERFLQERPTPAPLPPNTQPPIQPPPTPAPSPSGTQPPVPPTPSPTPTPIPESQTIPVKKINITGSTVFSSEQFNPIVQSVEGKSLTLEQLREVADKITQLYLEQGYITSRAILVDQRIVDGVVEIRILEGSLEKIEIEGTRRLNPDYVRSRIQLGARTPLNTAQLEDQLRLLRADPLFENVEASLRAGSRTGQSVLIVRIVEANPFEGNIGIDNYSPPSVGSERLGLNLRYRNLTGDGDEVATSFYHTTRNGADSFELSYRVPLNPMNGALQFRTSLNRNKVVDSAFSFFDIQGNSQLYELSFQQPLIRTPREEFSLSLGFGVQRSEALAGPFPISPGADAEGITKTSVMKFGQDYLRRDPRGAWSMRSLFSLGTGWLGATINQHPEPDARFFSWLGQVQRVQVLNQDNFLILGTDIQLTPNSLLPSQQFVIGGGQSLRGYRQNIRAGDNGVRFSMEDRLTLDRDADGATTFQLAPFFDAGYVWNHSNNPGNENLPSQRFLAGLGLGLIWEPMPRLSLRLDYGVPLINLTDRGKNAQDNGFYFSVNYQL